MGRAESSADRARYVISVAAELAGVHPQTLRVYERKGLLAPHRTAGNTRRYSERDIELLKRIQELTQQGVNLAGVTRILELEEELEDLRAKHREELAQAEAQLQEALEGRASSPLVLLKDVRRIRRAMKTDVIERAGRRRVFPAPPGSTENKR